MRGTLAALALLLAVAAGRPDAQTSPSLVVILVVDQMRADYLRTFERHWQRGFRTLLQEGTVFERAAYPYMGTYTCPGHATIGTGTFPRTHGMISNAWYHRDQGESPECTADSTVAAVSYGREVRTGASPARLLAPTLADELRAQKPGARVVAISLKSRGAITLAGRAGEAVVWFDDTAGAFATSRTYAAAPVPEVKQFIDAYSHEYDFGRVWTLLGPPHGYVYGDAGIGERPPTGWTGLFPHALVLAGRAGGAGAQGAAAPTPAQQAATAQQNAVTLSGLWQSTPFANTYLGRMAVSLVNAFRLGQRGQTDFLSISFSTLDDVGHAFGPESREVEDILRHLDVTLGELIDALDARVGRSNYVLALSADHGVVPYAGFGRGGRVHTDDVRDRIDETLTERLGPLERGSYVASIGSGNVYLNAGVFERLKADGPAMVALERAILAMPGVARVLRADRLSDSSPDEVVRAAALSHVPGRSGDLIIVTQEHWVLLGRTVYATNHGTHYAYDTNVPLILLGSGIGTGRVTAAATPADIAPTLARRVGITMPRAEGRVLTEALR